MSSLRDVKNCTISFKRKVIEMEYAWCKIRFHLIKLKKMAINVIEMFIVEVDNVFHKILENIFH